MSDEHLPERITVNPKVMIGKPVTKGTRLTVEYIVDRLAHGATADSLLSEYEGLQAEDVAECLLCSVRQQPND